MKFFLKSAFLILFFNAGIVFAQKELPPQYRFFADYSVYAGLEDPISKSTIHGALGLQFKVGSDWYLNRGNFHGVLKFTWIRAGLHIGNGVGVFYSPLNLGLGHQFQISRDFSITACVNVGFAGVADDILIPSWTNFMAFVPEISANFSIFSIVLEYSQRPYLWYNSNEIFGYYRYIGLSFRRHFLAL